MTSTLPPFVIVGLQPWDTPIGSNCKNIAQELAKRTSVLYINIPLDWNTLIKNKEEDIDHINYRKAVQRGKKPQLEEVEPNLWVLTPRCVIHSINMLPAGGIYNFFNRKNNKKIAAEIKPAITRLGFKDYYLFNDSDMFRSFYMKEFLKPDLSIYYSRDNLISTDYFRKHGTHLEPQLIAKSDLATANSTYLRDYCKQFNAHSYYIGQGCDLSIFNPEVDAIKPKDLRTISGPIIGYIGFLTAMRLDIDLLVKLAHKQPDWQIVLVGPQDENFKKSDLHNYSNVHFLGSKKPEELGTYLKFFDVAINPQVVNDMTIGNYPRKVDEYLAMGKPVVATKTKAMSVFENHCYLASDAHEYESFIKSALRDDTSAIQKKRIAFAHEHTWENSVSELIKSIDKARSY